MKVQQLMELLIQLDQESTVKIHSLADHIEDPATVYTTQQGEVVISSNEIEDVTKSHTNVVDAFQV